MPETSRDYQTALQVKTWVQGINNDTTVGYKNPSAQARAKASILHVWPNATKYTKLLAKNPRYGTMFTNLFNFMVKYEKVWKGGSGDWKQAAVLSGGMVTVLAGLKPL